MNYTRSDIIDFMDPIIEWVADTYQNFSSRYHIDVRGLNSKEAEKKRFERDLIFFRWVIAKTFRAYFSSIMRLEFASTFLSGHGYAKKLLNDKGYFVGYAYSRKYVLTIKSVLANIHKDVKNSGYKDHSSIIMNGFQKTSMLRACFRCSRMVFGQGQGGIILRVDYVDKRTGWIDKKYLRDTDVSTKIEHFIDEMEMNSKKGLNLKNYLYKSNLLRKNELN